ncbi:sugar-specific transcriptional regulator trmb [Lucifera butyrica]|uniref:Sugar-specific transcriptional regulator trmb n=1 Tax=Lucifera butyrica TaxID=1351585 RepID=A0A498RD94_9FIRM|nr:TrmB family transcriptional regulator [Lucifera butyrica]VBB09524.1 sugar-specific transcriptional regulator trmb [Lucifera butyrica]
MNDIILKLEQLGFSSYEAKAYYALIRKYPINGYEISKIGKIPSAKIYDTINRLRIKGAIVESTTESGKYYPVPADTLLAKLKQEFTLMIQDLEGQLKKTEPLPDIDVTHNFSGYETFAEKTIGLIQNASVSLLLSVWPEEEILVSDAIAQAKKRGVTVVAGIFGNSSIESNYYINLDSCGVSSQARLGNRLNIIIGDSKEVVICEMGENGKAEGVWTTTPSIILVAKEYIKHDIWGNVLIDIIGKERFNSLCENNEMLSYLIRTR